MSDRKLKDRTKDEQRSAATVTAPSPATAEPAGDGHRPGRERLVTRRVLGIAAISIIGPALALALGLYLYLSGGRYVSTDNAYVKSEKIAVSSDISGRVRDVLVRANQDVRRGDVLFKLDEEPFRIAHDRAKAGLLAARQEGEALKSLYRQKLAGIERAKVDLAFQTKRFDRQRQLKRKAIASQSTFETAQQNLQAAKVKLNELAQDLAQVNAKLGGRPDIAIDRLTGVMQAAAALAAAELNLKRTVVRASLDGIITNFDLQVGEYVEEGKTVFSIVGSRDLWVEANFRETDMAHMRTGQTAKISIDAYPRDRRQAVLESIDPATGAEFALLPPQNATGNWVKVVQRLPVRFKLSEPLRSPRLRAGMSVVVTVDTGHERSLGELWHWAMDRLGS